MEQNELAELAQMDMKQTLFHLGRDVKMNLKHILTTFFVLSSFFHRSLQQRYEGFSNSREEHCDRCRRRSRSCRNDFGGRKRRSNPDP